MDEAIEQCPECSRFFLWGLIPDGAMPWMCLKLPDCERHKDQVEVTDLTDEERLEAADGGLIRPARPSSLAELEESERA